MLTLLKHQTFYKFIKLQQYFKLTPKNFVNFAQSNENMYVLFSHKSGSQIWQTI